MSGGRDKRLRNKLAGLARTIAFQRKDIAALRVNLARRLSCPSCGKCFACNGTGIREYGPSQHGRCDVCRGGA